MNGAIGMTSRCGMALVPVGPVLMGCKASQPAAASSIGDQTAASDWVDFALDRQTVINPSTGVVTKITNQVTVEQPSSGPTETALPGRGFSGRAPH